MRRFDVSDVPLDGINLVEASAGTGKTHAIATLVARLVVERDVAIDRLLVVTFTEAATKELATRVRQRLSMALDAFERGTAAEDAIARLVEQSRDNERDAARLGLAVANADEARVCTIHAFCQRTLIEHAFASGTTLDLELVPDVGPLSEEVVGDFFARELARATADDARALYACRLTPSGLLELAARVARNPEARLVPAPGDARAPSSEAFRSALSAVVSACDRKGVQHALYAGGVGKKYRKDHVERWLDEVEAYLELAPDVPSAPKALERFRTTTLAAGGAGADLSHAFFDACERLVVAVEGYQAAQRAYALSFKHRLAEDLRRELPRRLEAANAVSYDELLRRLLTALRGPLGERLASQIRTRRPVALIDEFQDTDPLQAEIFQRIYPEGTLFLIGDPKQAIYSFRGADVFAYMRAREHVREERRYTMATNWRSDATLVAAIARLFSRAPRPFVHPEIELPEVSAAEPAPSLLSIPAELGSAPLQLRFARRNGSRPIAKGATRERLPAATAAEIADLLRPESRVSLGGRPLAPGDLAVLTKTNAQAFLIQDALRRLSVPSVVIGDQSVMSAEHPDAHDLQAVLAAVAEPSDPTRVRTALMTRLFGWRARDLVEPASVGGASSWLSWEEQMDRFRDHRSVWLQRGFIHMFRRLVEGEEMLQRLLDRPDGERRATNLLHLGELLHAAATSRHLGPSGLLSWLSRERRRAKAKPDAAQIRLESDSDTVTITTVHKSKGLEYPVVFCPYAWDGRLLYGDEQQELFVHDPSRDYALELDLSGDLDGPLGQRALLERFAESVRLLYVALTRAKHRCYVVWGAFTDFETSALGYLLHPPPLVVDAVTTNDVASHLSSLSDERMARELAELEGTDVRALDLERVGKPVPPVVVADTAFAARPVPHRIRRWATVASFTRLTAVRAGTPTDADDDARDIDEAGHLGDGKSQVVEDTRLPAPEALAPLGVSRRVRLVDFPRGARAGTFFHSLLETLDFAAVHVDPSAVERRAATLLRAFGYAPELGRVVVDAIGDVVDTPLMTAKSAFKLREVPKDARIDELEFMLPVAGRARARAVPRGTQLSLALSGKEHGGTGRLTARRLADVLAAHPSDALLSDYASRVERLSFGALEGYLKGYIDLVFVRQGRWYLVDYKTNHLGDEQAAYAAALLPTAMADGHYYLQYHLYAVALHRYLGRLVAGYDYERCFGGVLYLFLKGMSPETGSRSGVFFERPPLARIEALSELIDGPREEGA